MPNGGAEAGGKRRIPPASFPGESPAGKRLARRLPPLKHINPSPPPSLSADVPLTCPYAPREYFCNHYALREEFDRHIYLRRYPCPPLRGLLSAPAPTFTHQLRRFLTSLGVRSRFNCLRP